MPASASEAPLPGSLPASEGREEPAPRIAVVTGASSGIGLYTALGLARTGMRVVMTGRDPARTEAARRFVTERASGAQVETALADFASLAEVRRLAGEILSRHDRLDLLVNNAGLFSPKFERSADGYEMTFAVNHLAPVPADQSTARPAEGLGAGADRHRRLARPSRCSHRPCDDHRSARLVDVEGI